MDCSACFADFNDIYYVTGMCSEKVIRRSRAVSQAAWVFRYNHTTEWVDGSFFSTRHFDTEVVARPWRGRDCDESDSLSSKKIGQFVPFIYIYAIGGAVWEVSYLCGLCCGKVQNPLVLAKCVFPCIQAERSLKKCQLDWLWPLLFPKKRELAHKKEIGSMVVTFLIKDSFL